MKRMSKFLSNRNVTKAFGWIQLVLAISMLIFLTALSWYVVTQETDNRDGRLTIVWFKIAFLLLDQIAQLCASMVLITATSVSTPPAKAITLIKIWAWVTFLFAAAMLIICLSGELPLILIFCWLPFKTLFIYVFAYKFLLELKEVLNNSSHVTSLPGQTGMQADGGREGTANYYSIPGQSS